MKNINKNESISSTFNLIKIYNQSMFNQDLSRNSIKGKLIWANGKIGTIVKWIPL